MCKDTLIVLTFSISKSYEDKSLIDQTALQLSLPADIYFCGILYIGECKEIDPDIFKVIVQIYLVYMQVPYWYYLLRLCTNFKKIYPDYTLLLLKIIKYKYLNYKFTNRVTNISICLGY